MTDTATPAPTHVDPPRDRYGRYLIPDPNTGKDMPYTRATTFAKTVSDTFGLTKWMLRMGGIGLAQRQDLLLGVSACDPADSKTLDKLMAEAKDHAGAMSGATIGTALHSFTEAVDRGQTPSIPEPWDADVAAYQQAVADAGLEIIPEYIEQVVVIPDLQVAGTLDRIVRTSDGRLVIADLKTGKSVDYSMGEISVQLALYAAATHIFDPATGELTPMPDVDQTEALVFHAPAGTGTCTVLSVDIAAGRDMFTIIDVVRAWRKRRDLSTPYSPQQAAPPPQPTAHDRLAWLTVAMQKLVEWDQLEAMAQAWPEGVPTLRQAREGGVELTSPQLDAIFRAMVSVAARAQLSFDLFDTPYPGDDLRELRVNDANVQHMRDRMERLPSDLAEVVAGRCAANGIPKLSSGKATVQHLHVVDTHMTDAENQLQARRATAAAHVGEFPADAQASAMHIAGCSTPQLMTQQVVERLGVLADAYNLGHLAVSDGQVVVAKGADKALLDRMGSKTNIVNAAKPAAKLLGLDRPTSSTKVTSDPMLLAATFIEGQVPTSEQETSS